MLGIAQIASDTSYYMWYVYVLHMKFNYYFYSLTIVLVESMLTAVPNLIEVFTALKSNICVCIMHPPET